MAFHAFAGQSCVLACQVIFPLNPADGIIWHLSGRGSFGAWLGVRDSANVPVLRVRIGNGSSFIDSARKPSSPDLAYVDAADFPRDNSSHQIAVEIAVHESKSFLRLWIDGQPKGFGSMESTDWVKSGSGLTSYGLVATGDEYEGTCLGEYPRGEPKASWPGGLMALTSNLRLRIDTASYPPCFPSVLRGDWASDASDLEYVCEGAIGGNCSLQKSPFLNTSFSNVVARGAWSVTVAGMRFGFADSTLRSNLGDTACESTLWISNTALSMKTAAGIGSTISTVISVMSSLGLTGASVVSYDKPSPWSSELMSHQVNRTVQVYVREAGSADSSPRSRTGVTSSASTSWVSDSALALRVDTAIGLSLRMALTVGNHVGSSTAMLSFEAIRMYNATANVGSTRGSVSVLGAGLGLVAYTVLGRIGQTGCEGTQWESETSVSCLTSYGVRGSQCVVLTAGNQIETFSHAISYHEPVLLNLSQSNLHYSSTFSVFLSGGNLGDSDMTVREQAGSTSLEATHWISATGLLGKHPSGSRGSLVVSVTSGQIPGSHSKILSYDAGVVSGSSVMNSAGGQLQKLWRTSSRQLAVVLSGVARLGNSACELTEWLSETAVRVRALSGFTMQRSAGAIVTSGLRYDSISGMFSFDGAEQISALSSHNGATSALHTFGLIGFGVAQYYCRDFTFRSRIGNSGCERTTWISASQIGCLAPKGTGSTIQVHLTGGSGVGTISDVFSFDSPNQANQDILMLDRNSPTLGMSTLTVAGVNFATADVTPGIRLGGSAAQTKWLADTLMFSKTPQGARFSYGRRADGTKWCCAEPATVTVACQMSTMSEAFSYDVHQVTAITSTNALANGHTILTFAGSSLLASDQSLPSRVGATSAQITQWCSDSILRGYAATGHGLDHNIVVTMFRTESSSLSLLTYDGPNLLYSNVTLPAWPVVNFIPGSTQVVSILGKGMSRYGLSSSVRINTASQSSLWISDSAMLCKLMGQSERNMPVRVTVAERIGTRSQVLSYDLHFVMDSFSKVIIDDRTLQFGAANLRNRGSYNTVLHGSNFGAWSLTGRAAMGISATEATQWITSSRVFCKFSAGIGQTRPVVLTIAAVSTTQTVAVSFDRPVLADSKFTLHFQGFTRASFSNIAAHESETMQVGSFFYVPELVLVGNDLGDVDYSPKISIGISSCSTTIWRSLTRIVCKAVAGVSASYSAAVTAAHGVGSLTDALSYNVPSHRPSQSSNIVHQKSSVMVVSILRGLTTSDCTSKVRLGSSASESTSWKSDSSVLARVCEGQMRTARAVLSIGTQASSCTESMTFDQLIVSSASTVNSPAADVFHKILQISSLSVSRNAQFSSSGAVGGSSAEFSVWSSTSGLICRFSAGSGASAQIYVTSGLQVSSSTQALSFDGRILLAITTTNLPIDNSRNYFIAANLKMGMSPSVTLGSSSCQKSSWLSVTAMLCRHATTDARGSRGVVVTAFAHVSTKSALVSFDSAFLSSSRIQNEVLHYDSNGENINALSNLPAIGAEVVLLGNNNFPRSFTPAARAFGTSAMFTIWTSATNVVAKFHNGLRDPKSQRPVTLSVGSRCCSITEILSFDSPSLQSLATKGIGLTRRSNAPAAHSQTVAASAMSIGKWDYSMGSRVGFSGSAATFWTSSTSLTLKQSFASIGRVHLTLVASVGSSPGSISLAFSYDRQVLFAETTISNAPVLENRPIRISGAGFGIADSTPQIRIGKTACTASSWASDQEMHCRYQKYCSM